MTPQTISPQEKMLRQLMDQLDEEQRYVASWQPTGKNLRVVAAAGSGKTSSVVALAANLVTKEQVLPNHLIVMTFSRKAAEELRTRMAKVLPHSQLQQIRIGTFHSLGLQALRQIDSKLWSMDRCIEADGSTRAAGVPSRWEIWTAICSYGTVPGTQEESLRLPEPASYYSTKIDQWRAQGYRKWEDVPPVPGMMHSDREAFRKVWKFYNECKQSLKAWDFTDVLESWENALKEQKLPVQNNIVLVDEAQDNNQSQFNIVKLLAHTDGRICLIGDLRQCIYQWRGAHPDIFQNAETTIQAETREITTNYRSEAPIVALSNYIASGKKWNIGSPAKAARVTKDAPYAIELLPPSFGPDEEADAVAERLANDISSGEKPSDYVILCRTNAGRALFEAALTRRNVPICVIGGSSVFKTREAETVLAYCVLSQHDAIGSLDRILNQPKRFIPHSFVAAVHRALPVSADIIDAIDVASKGAKLKPGSKRGVQDLIRDLEKLRMTEWAEVPKLVEKILKSDPTREVEDADQDRMSLISSACRVAERFGSAIEFVTFAQKCSDGTAQLTEGSKPENCVTLSTCHAVKGLQWEHVYVSSNKTMFPHVKSTNREEENRLFYVAVTRAARRVTFSWNKLEGLTSFLPSAEKFSEFVKTN
jgi:DNA helicase-2/ATP-dependent DNA helicase PcrA